MEELMWNRQVHLENSWEMLVAVVVVVVAVIAVT